MIKNEIDFGNIDLGLLSTLPLRRSLGEHVFSHLREAILKGEISPRTRLIENRLAKSLKISRTPVREAFHKLESEGLIKPIPQGGYVVLGLSKEDIQDIFGIRSLLESYAAGLAARNRRESDLRLLEEKNEAAQLCIDEDQLNGLPGINTEFHSILYALSRRPKLIEMINTLQAQTYRFRKIILTHKRHAEISIKTHRDLIKALKKKDSARAEKLIKTHILRGQRIVMASLESDKAEF